MAGSCSLVVLISGRGSNLKHLIEALEQGLLDITIEGVVSNRPEAPGLEYACQAGIPTAVVDHRQYDDRQRFDQALAQVVQRWHPTLVVLAGFMRILSEAFVEQFTGRMINLHPSLLPKYRGLHTHQRALDAGDPEHGASIHYVTVELDGGPVIMQHRITVEESDDAVTLAARILPFEHQMLIRTVDLICNGRIQFAGGAVAFDGATLAQPLPLHS